MSNSWWPHGLKPTRLLCPGDSLSKNTGVGCHFLLQGVFLTQGLNSCLLYWQANSPRLKHQGGPHTIITTIYNISPSTLKWTITSEEIYNKQTKTVPEVRRCILRGRNYIPCLNPEDARTEMNWISKEARLNLIDSEKWRNQEELKAIQISYICRKHCQLISEDCFVKII